MNRKLTPYPLPDPNTGLIANANLQQYDSALKDRQALARDIFNVLQQIVGAKPPDAGVSADELNALRVLAQIAVNIVDFIDEDDIITPFNWFRSEWVFGVELPRLVLNEVYVQYDNDPNDPGIGPGVSPLIGERATTHYNVNVWAELLNPLDGRYDPAYNTRPSGPAAPNKDVETRLANAAGPIYQVVIADALRLARPCCSRATSPETRISASPAVASRVRAVASDFGPNAVVKPVDGSYSTARRTSKKRLLRSRSQGRHSVAGEDPNLPTSHKSTGMTYQVPVTVFGSRKPPQPTILLRRLACPGLPFQPAGEAALLQPVRHGRLRREDHARLRE